MLFTFRKPERLCLKKDIEELFSAGSTSMTAFPLRATFRAMPYSGHGPHAKVLLSVSKRRLHHATDRNRVKRQLREAYRLKKSILLAHIPEDRAVNIAFVWLSERNVQTSVVLSRMENILQRISERL